MSEDLLQVGDTVKVHRTLFNDVVDTVLRVEGNVAILKEGLWRVHRRIEHGKYVHQYRKRETEWSPVFEVTARAQAR